MVEAAVETVEQIRARHEDVRVRYARKDVLAAIMWLEQREETAARYSDVIDSLRDAARVLEGGPSGGEG